MKIAIIVHGGAGNVPTELHAGFESGCRTAAEAGWSVLAGGGSALDAVETAVRILENDPVFDAGAGAHLNQDGDVELANGWGGRCRQAHRQSHHVGAADLVG
jgi:L-asparaginase / beta-aspartyl-peptidase